MATRVIIVGGGFAGINAAKKLARSGQVEITIIDKKNHHLFQPLLYQVAMAGLSPADIAVPIRSIVGRRKNVRVLMGEVKDVDLLRRRVRGGFGELEYDYLILACGSEQSYFGHEEWRKYAPGLKSLEEATDIRRRTLVTYELAERETDPKRKQSLLTFVVVGGGPTGVELAGSIGEISRHTLRHDFKNIDPRDTRIYLLEGGPRILPSFDESLSTRAINDLKELGVTVRTNSLASEITSEGVRVGEEFIEAKTVLWAAGVKPPELNKKLQSQGVELDRQGRIFVEADLSLKLAKNVFVLGDQAHTKDKQGKPLPGLAPVAIQQGQFIADLIRRELKNKERKSFSYVDKGQMATIGRSRAVAEAFGLKFGGFFAWLVWLFVHIYFLVGFRNRLFVFTEWAWSYTTYKRAARLIVGCDLDKDFEGKQS